MVDSKESGIFLLGLAIVSPSKAFPSGLELPGVSLKTRLLSDSLFLIAKTLQLC